VTGTWIYAENDKDWSRIAHEKYNNCCAWLGCSSNFGLGAHHAIPRGFLSTRLITDNAVLLCAKHHGIMEDCKGTIKYEQLICILIGTDVYKALKEMAEYSLKIKPDEGNIKSSEVEIE
jgi:hypothetical protein